MASEQCPANRGPDNPLGADCGLLIADCFLFRLHERKLMSGRRVSLHAQAALSRHGRRAAWIVRERACHFLIVAKGKGGALLDNFT